MNARKLEEQLNYVINNVPFYHESVRHGTCLDDFPLVTKSEIKKDYGAFISDQFRQKRQRLVSFLRQDRIEHDRLTYNQDIKFDDEIVVIETGGSSGVPFRCPKTVSERMLLGMGMWRQRRTLDFAIEDKLLYRFAHGTQGDGLNPHVCSLSNLMGVYRAVAQGRYRWLHTLPEILKRHLEVFIQEGWRPSIPDIRFIECTGQFLSEEDRAYFSEYFGVTVIDQYAMQETWGIALTCVHGVHHINDYNVVVEIIDENGNPVPFGETGQIVVSSLQEHLLPFVRYVTGDIGALMEKRCDCALGSTALRISEGREIHVIKGSADRIFGNNIFRWVAHRVRKKIDCYDLRYLRVKQVSANEFVLETNQFRRQAEFARSFHEITNEFLGREVHLQHITVDDSYIEREELKKPWLFRCEF